MAPLTKDTTEVTNSAADANRLKSGTAAKTEQQAGHSRADAVSLEVPVKVHGSRVTEVVREITPHTEPFEEQTSTMIVFPQGAVIRMSTAVSVGQMLVVTNLKSRQDAICRVVKVRTFSNLQGYVEVEFTHKQPGYWNIYFPSDGPAPANKLAQPIAAASAPPAIKKTPDTSASEISWAPAPTPEPVVQKPAEPTSFSPVPKPPAVVLPVNSAAKPEAPFISIGSQEEVQPAASIISGEPAAQLTPRIDVVKKPAPQAKSNVSSVLESPPAPPAQTPMEALPADAGASSSASESLTEPAPVAAAPSWAAARSTFGSLSGGAILSRSRPESPIVEPVLSSLEDAASGHQPSSGTNWILIAACIAVLFAAVVGGAIYFRNGSSGSGSRAASAPASAQPGEAVTTNTAQPSSTNPSPPLTANSSAGAALNVKPSVVVNGNVPVQTHDAQVAANHAAAPAKQSELRVTPDMMSATLNAHPVSSQRAADAQGDAAPALNVMAPVSASNSALPGLGSSDVASPPVPEIRPDGPVKVGGQVKEPRLLASTLPIYPPLAKQSNTQGDVVIKATIDKNGRVAHMDVVSGPTALRQSAIEALGRWKYEPSRLNGQPVDVQILVTIKFRR
jgi:TonB family protein